MYYLKLFDETLLKFDMDNTITLKISNIQILSADKKHKKRPFAAEPIRRLLLLFCAPRKNLNF